MGKIEGILFDFGGTLDSNGWHWYDRMFELCVQRGMNVDRPTFERLAGVAGKRIFRHPDIRRLSHHATVLRLLKELEYLLDPHFLLDAVTMARDFVALAQPCLKRNLEVVEKLSQEFRLGLLSNNWGNARGWCEQYGYHRHLRIVVDSGLAGVSKPNPKIFDLGLRELGLPAPAVAYVGDRYYTDMVGAKRAGLSAVWVRRHQSLERLEHNGTVDHVISALPQLLDVAREHWANSGNGHASTGPQDHGPQDHGPKDHKT